MNGYGRDAQAYWQRWLPRRHAEIQDPDTLFAELGDRVAEHVTAAWDRLMTEDDPPPGERRAAREQRIARLKRDLEGAALRAMVFLPPEPAEHPGDALSDDAGQAGTGEGIKSAAADEWWSETCAALIEGRLTVDELNDTDLKELIAYASPGFLLAVGTSVDEQRAKGRPV